VTLGAAAQQLPQAWVAVASDGPLRRPRATLPEYQPTPEAHRADQGRIKLILAALLEDPQAGQQVPLSTVEM